MKALNLNYNSYAVLFQALYWHEGGPFDISHTDFMIYLGLKRKAYEGAVKAVAIAVNDFSEPSNGKFIKVKSLGRNGARWLLDEKCLNKAIAQSLTDVMIAPIYPKYTSEDYQTKAKQGKVIAKAGLNEFDKSDLINFLKSRAGSKLEAAQMQRKQSAEVLIMRFINFQAVTSWPSEAELIRHFCNWLRVAPAEDKKPQIPQTPPVDWRDKYK